MIVYSQQEDTLGQGTQSEFVFRIRFPLVYNVRDHSDAREPAAPRGYADSLAHHKQVVWPLYNVLDVCV